MKFVVWQLVVITVVLLVRFCSVELWDVLLTKEQGDMILGFQNRAAFELQNMIPPKIYEAVLQNRNQASDFVDRCIIDL